MTGRRRTYWALAAWLVVTALFVVCGRGSLGHFITLGMATVAAFGCWAMDGLIFMFARPAPSGRREASHVFLIAATVLFGSWASVPFGLVLYRRDVAEARAFCEALIPAIERFKAETGRYPQSPPGLAEIVAWPRLIRKDDWFYHAIGMDDYRFDFVDPGGLFSGFKYESSTGRWDGSGGWD